MWPEVLIYGESVLWAVSCQSTRPSVRFPRARGRTDPQCRPELDVASSSRETSLSLQRSQVIREQFLVGSIVTIAKPKWPERLPFVKSWHFSCLSLLLSSVVSLWPKMTTPRLTGSILSARKIQQWEGALLSRFGK